MNDSIEKVMKAIKPLDAAAMASAASRQDTLTKPPGSLGRLEKLSVQLAGIQRRALPAINQKAIITMAGDHGVVAEKIGNWPQDVTAQMVANFLRGGAGINVLAQQVDARIVVVDMGVATELKSDPRLISKKIGSGTNNIARGPAMTIAQAEKSIDAGIEIVSTEAAKGLDIIGIGDMGIGNTAASSAICAVITGKPVAEVTGRGTGLTDEQLAHKVAVLERALEVNHPDPSHPLDVLAKIGGFEIGGLAGVILAGAAQGIPVVIDGFITGAAALIAVSLSPAAKDYFIAAHNSAEPGHRTMLQHLGLVPLLDLGMRLGEGTGAALGICLAEAAVKLLSQMATFDEAGVSDKD